jgi:sirohydrochlorin cobaltochelatase
VKKYNLLPLLLAAALILSLFAGCAGSASAPNAPVALSYEEGTNPSDEIVNTSAAEKVVLVVSFGTSFNQSRHDTIGGIEAAFKAAFPDYQIRRAFTAQIIIDKLAERDKLNIDNIEQAMDRLVLDKVKEVVIQPTTVLAGYEYDDVIAAITPYADKFESFKVGKPLLMDDSDYDAVADVVLSELAAFEAAGTDVLLMGHGTHHEANATYPRFENLLREKGHDDIYVGTVEGGALIEDLQPVLKEKGTKKVVLRPLMIVAGDHANNDMAGSEPESWKSVLEADGYEVETVLEGLGQIKAIQDMFVDHAKDALNSNGVTLTPAAAKAAAGLPGASLKDGTYPITVDSSASMFKIVDCMLTVQDGEMSAVMTLSAQGFGKVYMGTGEAALTDAANVSEFTLNGERHSFAVPVAALDTQLDCAGWSIRKEQWYDHTVVFNSASVPAEAFKPQEIAVTLTGGSGKASVQSPAKLLKVDGAAHAEIVWSSPNYSYMKIGETQYNPVNTEGNSTFVIPVELDADMQVIACTVAMSAPKEIEYTLRFDSSTIK